MSEKLNNNTPTETEQFNFEIEERIAIMVFDGNVPEAEAEELARVDVINNRMERESI